MVDIYVIFNSRNIKNEEENIYKTISEEMYTHITLDKIIFFEILAFDNEKIENWLDAYANEMAKFAYANKKKKVEDKDSEIGEKIVELLRSRKRYKRNR